MAIIKYIADADNTITNAYREDLVTQGTGANMGASDVVEVFKVYAQASTSSLEYSRVLMKFPISGSNSITVDRSAGTIPASGSVEFWLRLYNAQHDSSLPSGYELHIEAISASWNEGTGLDMEQYKDVGASNWLSRSAGVAWSKEGGDFYSGSTGISHFTASFPIGTEDVEVNITRMVEQWLRGSGSEDGIPNYGLGIRLSQSYEDDATRSYYTKKFFGKGTQYWFKRPCIEARWDDSKQDDRSNFYYSSSLAPSVENLNTIYLYNYVRGQLKNIPAVGTTGSFLVSLYSGSADNTAPSGSRLIVAQGGNCTHADGTNLFVTGGYVSTGIYSASFALTSAATPLTRVFDVWTSGSGDGTNSIHFFTGTINPVVLDAHDINPDAEYKSSIQNLKPIYNRREKGRFRIFTRKKDWSPTIYSKATATITPHIIESGSYRIYRVIDEVEVVPFATGSTLYTRLSNDASGSYFDLDMSIFESGYSYAIQLAFYNGAIGTWQEQDETFKFRVE